MPRAQKVPARPFASPYLNATFAPSMSMQSASRRVPHWLLAPFGVEGWGFGLGELRHMCDSEPPPSCTVAALPAAMAYERPGARMTGGAGAAGSYR
eukprot:5034756-Prymnesium_polylepis.1